MRGLRVSGIAAVLISVLVSFAAADELKLKNGDVLRGTIVSRDNEKVVFDHEALGRVTVPADRVEAVTIGQPAPTPTPAQATPVPPVAAAAPGTTNEKEPPAASPPGTGFLDNWAAKLELGVNGSAGNTDSIDGHVGFTADKKTDADRWAYDAAAFYGKSDGEETRGEITTGLVKDWLFPPTPWTWFAEGRYDYNDFKDWQHRLAGHTGPGYQFIKRDDLELIGRVGAGAREEFGSDDSDVHPEGFVNGSLKWKITARQTLGGTTTYFPALDDISDFRIRNTLDWTLLIDQADHISLKFGIIHDYESKVESDTRRNDVKYFGAVVFDF